MKSCEIRINDDVITESNKCYIIAEIGNNHQGSLQMAKEMFRCAKECGANAVKLQKRDNISLYTKEMYNKCYDHENSFGLTYGEHREKLEFGMNEYKELKNYAKEIGITFFATAFDFHSVDFLEEIDLPAYKIASGDLKNIPLLKYVAKLNKPIFISTGGGAMEDVERAFNAIHPINKHVCIMQCTAGYPVSSKDMNLQVISTFKHKFPEAVIGLSDHQNGIAMAVVAFALGARVIEKHFTLNRSFKGTDHSFSLEPIGLKKLVRDLTRAYNALGDGIKRPYPCEKQPLIKMEKMLAASKNLQAGHVLQNKDILIKSPNKGVSPFKFDEMLGKTLKRNINEDDPILFEDLE